MVCTFFGHSNCRGLDVNVLQNTIEELIHKGADTFYVGNQGRFDGMVFSSLMALKKIYSSISISVVLAYLPTQGPEHDLYHGYSMYPEGIEIGPPQFAIDRRNRWMIDKADCCLCFVNHTWGGAYRYAVRAQKKKLKLINLGDAEL